MIDLNVMKVFNMKLFNIPVMLTYTCDKCNLTFGMNENLKQHIKHVHEGHTCVKCLLTFEVKECLNDNDWIECNNELNVIMIDWFECHEAFQYEAVQYSCDVNIYLW